MANSLSFSSSSSLFLALSLWVVFLISPAHSLTCTSQKFTNNNVYTDCLDLPTLSAYLHYSYDTANTTLSIAFIATPAKTNGWVAWAINPNKTGMDGSQALVAYKDTNGAVTVKTYNITGYSSIVQSKLAFEVWDLSGEEVSGAMRIFGKVKVPADLAAKGTVNQVWQVGPGVGTGGMLEKHDFAAANLQSKGVLKLVGSSESPSGAPSPSAGGPSGGGASGPSGGAGGPSGGGASGGGAASGPDKAGGSRIGDQSNVGLILGFVLLIGSFIAF